MTSPEKLLWECLAEEDCDDGQQRGVCRKRRLFAAPLGSTCFHGYSRYCVVHAYRESESWDEKPQAARGGKAESAQWNLASFRQSRMKEYREPRNAAIAGDHDDCAPGTLGSEPGDSRKRQVHQRGEETSKYEHREHAAGGRDHSCSGMAERPHSCRQLLIIVRAGNLTSRRHDRTSARGAY